MIQMEFPHGINKYGVFISCNRPQNIRESMLERLENPIKIDPVPKAVNSNPPETI
jgi:hypothetical protein